MSFDAAFNRIARKREADEKVAREREVVDAVNYLQSGPQEDDPRENMRRLFVKSTINYRPPEAGIGRVAVSNASSNNRLQVY